MVEEAGEPLTNGIVDRAHRLRRQMRVSLCCLRLCATEQLPDQRKGCAIAGVDASERVPEVMEPDVIQACQLTNAPPGFRRLTRWVPCLLPTITNGLSGWRLRDRRMSMAIGL